MKALTGDAAIQPRDQLFATLDVTAHAGSLPSRMTVIYMDTIGFLSQLPHGLIESFSATLEDVAQSVSMFIPGTKALNRQWGRGGGRALMQHYWRQVLTHNIIRTGLLYDLIRAGLLQMTSSEQVPHTLPS